MQLICVFFLNSHHKNTCYAQSSPTHLFFQCALRRHVTFSKKKGERLVLPEFRGEKLPRFQGVHIWTYSKSWCCDQELFKNHLFCFKWQIVIQNLVIRVNKIFLIIIWIFRQLLMVITYPKTAFFLKISMLQPRGRVCSLGMQISFANANKQKKIKRIDKELIAAFRFEVCHALVCWQIGSSSLWKYQVEML